MNEDLKKLFDEAKADAMALVAQRAWDAHLVKTWRERPFLPVFACAAEFFHGSNSSGLERVPAHDRHNLHCSVTRFVAAYLPKTNDALWDGRSDDYVLLVIAREKLSKVASDELKVRDEKYAKRSAIALDRLAKTKRSMHASNLEKNARRSWSTVK